MHHYAWIYYCTCYLTCPINREILYDIVLEFETKLYGLLLTPFSTEAMITPSTEPYENNTATLLPYINCRSRCTIVDSKFRVLITILNCTKEMFIRVFSLERRIYRHYILDKKLRNLDNVY